MSEQEWEAKKREVESALWGTNGTPALDGRWEIKREHFPDQGIDLTWVYDTGREKTISVMFPTKDFMAWTAHQLKRDVMVRAALAMLEDMAIHSVEETGDGTYTHTFTAGDYKDFAGV